MSDEHLERWADTAAAMEERGDVLTYTQDYVLDLRDARATIASQAEELAAMKAENERLTRNLADTNHEFRVMVLAYEDQEKELAAAAAALKAAREIAEELSGLMYTGEVEQLKKRLLVTLTPKEPTR